ncbi:M20/M25/M40 family metallo-hydrolase [Pseudonocardia sp. HH130630-07]|uniref:M20/M25/M40 family metallo-hydrolase n=1 Tax=Pseudonocardia sp. HH130630-07 TaxID=1690815 RepID=UPI000A8448A4|nr:M20/M25/M40 family metallo-hydrolase [Pseudonocardia sp. HH130630-07]
MVTRWVAVLVLVGVACLSWADGRAPAPLPSDAPAQVFAADRAMRTVEELATGPRPVGSPAARQTRDELSARLSAAGLTTRVHASTGVDGRDRRMVAAPVDNLVATLPGTDPTGTVVLAAHYDSVANGPGAADDMSSVAAILEAVRALRTGPPLRNDLVVLFTDAEEPGLLGAQAWVREELGSRPTVVVNFEARGTSGPSLMFQTSTGNAGLVRAFAEAVPHPVGDSSLVEAYRLLDNDTDLSRVLDAGRPGLNFAFIEQPVNYHTTGDSPVNLDAASVQGHGEAALGLAQVLGARDLGPLDPAASGAAPEDDVTYFRFLGLLVVYPAWLVWPLAGLGLAAVAGAVVAGRRRGVLTVPRLLGVVVSVPVAAVVGAVLSVGLWELLVALRPAYADVGPFLHRPVPFQSAAVATAVLVTALWYLAVRRWAGAAAAATGAGVVVALLGVLTAATVPGVSFLFALPAIGAGLGLVATVLIVRTPVAGTAVAALGAVPAAVLLAPLSWELFALSGISDGVAVLVQVVVLALLAVVLVPTADAGAGRGWPVPVTAAVLAVVLAGTGLVLDRPSADRPQASHLAFLQDTGTGGAHWISADTAPAPWTAGYLDDGPARALPWPDDAPVRSGPATPLDRPGPVVEILERGPERLVVRVVSARGATSVTLHSDRPVPSVVVAPDGRPAVRRDGAIDEIRLHAVPASGMRVELTRPGPEPVALTVTDLTPGLTGAPGFRPRPPELRGSGQWSSDQVALSRTVSG